MSKAVQFKTTVPQFSQAVNRWSSVAFRNYADAFKTQGRLLSAELMKRTPPFSGKKLMRMLQGLHGENWGGFKDPELETMTALNIGKRRVEKDIRRVIFGAKGASTSPKVFKSQNTQPVVDFGILQKCEGKDAIRIFATKSGKVYGVDRQKFIANASYSQIKGVHEAARISRGRVTSAGTKDRVIGRWVWINALVTSAAALAAYIKKRQWAVGQGKGGWATAYMALGGQLSRRGWIGKHAGYSGAVNQKYSGGVHISIENHSKWASNGDPDRIIASSLQGREEAIKKDIDRILTKTWGKTFKPSGSQ